MAELEAGGARPFDSPDRPQGSEQRCSVQDDELQSDSVVDSKVTDHQPAQRRDSVQQGQTPASTARKGGRSRKAPAWLEQCSESECVGEAGGRRGAPAEKGKDGWRRCDANSASFEMSLVDFQKAAPGLSNAWLMLGGTCRAEFRRETARVAHQPSERRDG